MTRTVKQPDERRLEIVSAATHLFLNRGYESTSMKHLMDKLQIAKGTIYHYFTSKEELLEAVVEQLAEDYLLHLSTVFDQAQGNALQRISVLMTAGNVASPQSDFLKQLHRPGNIAMHTRLLAVTISKIAPLYTEIIKQGCKEGVFHMLHPLESVEFLLAGMQFMTDLGSFPWKQSDLQRRIAAMPNMIETQLGAPKGSFNFLTGGHTSESDNTIEKHD